MQSTKRAIEHNGAFIDNIIQHNLKSPGSRDKELMTLTMGMCTTRLTTGNIVKIKHALNIKRHIFVALHPCEITLIEHILW